MDISYDFFCSNHSYMLGSFCLFQRSTIGDKTLAASDAFIQYMDLMAFFKDVLSGNQSLTYTMTKGSVVSHWHIFLLFSIAHRIAAVILFKRPSACFI